MALSRVLAVSEILRTICRFSDPSNDLKLLCVSRSFYDATVPLVWGSVRGVEILLSLIPNVTCAFADDETKVMDIVIPSGKLECKRFKIYAPLVKHLEVYNQNIEQYSVSNWRKLMRFAREETMLENLTRLTLKTPSPKSDQMGLWIYVFLAPTLVEISVVPSSSSEQAIFSCLDTCTLLKDIHTMCPKIRFLSIFPEKEKVDEHQKRKSCNIDRLSNLWSGFLSDRLDKMQYLCELCTTTAVLMPNTVISLSRLPRLRNLAIYPTSHPFIPKKLTQENTFPALSEFSLNWVPHTLPALVWKLGIFKRLTSLNISFTTQPERVHTWLESLMPMIRDSSPHLINLFLDLDCTGELNLWPIDNVVRTMQTLPLRTLELVSVFIAEDLKVGDLVPPAWSQITVLKLPDHAVEAPRLILFTKLPALEHLVVDLSLSTPPMECKSATSDKRNLRFALLESSRRVDITGDMYRIAHWLLDIWPTITEVRWSNKAQDLDENKSQATSAALAAALNGMIDLHRELSETRLRLSMANGP